MLKKRTAAIIGLGSAARTIHLPALNKLPVTVVGGCDPAVNKGDFRFPVYSTPSELLDRACPEILIIATPPAYHYELTRLGLEAGCHVLCEKPFTENLDEADELIDLSQKAGRWIVVNNQYRFMNIHRKAKELIGQPEFGKLLFLRAHQTFFTNSRTEEGWRGTQQQRTAKEFATHVLDLCRYFFDSEPISIHARMPKPERPDGPDYLNLIQLEFSGDRVAHIILDRLSRGRQRYLDIQLDGTAGCVETHIGGGIEFRAGVKGGTRRPFLRTDISMGGWARLYQGESFQKIASDPLNLFAAATARLLAAFLDALESNTCPPCNAVDNRKTLALMLAAYEASQERTVHALSEPKDA